IVSSRVLLPRAAEGRDELAAALAAAGARVTAVAAYRTAALSAAELAPLAARLAAGRIDVVAFFAPSQVEALVAAAGAAVFARVPLVCAIGATTAAALAAHGIRVDVVPPSPEGHLLAAEIVS